MSGLPIIPPRWNDIVGKPSLGVTYYVDSAAADDSATGLAPGSPKKTLAAAVSAASSGDTVLLRRGGRWHEQLAPFARGVRLGGYGLGVPPIVDGSRLVPLDAWSLTGDAGVYTATVTFEEAIRAPGSSADRYWPALWSELDSATAYTGDRIDYYQNDESIAANIAYVAANPGTFTMHKSGSTEPDPAAAIGSEFVIYLHLPDSSDPGATGRKIYHTTQQSVATIWPDAEVSDLIIQRAGCKDMVGVQYSGSGNVDPARMERVWILDAAKHGVVGSGIEFFDCVATGLPSARSEGGGFHNYRSNTQRGVSRGTRFTRCYARGFGIGFYSHGDDSNPVHDFFNVYDCVADDCVTGLTAPNTRGKTIIDGLKVWNFTQYAAEFRGRASVSRLHATGNGSPAFCSVRNGAEIEMTDSFGILGGTITGGGSLFRCTDSGEATASLTNCTFLNMFGNAPSVEQNINISFDSCVYSTDQAEFPIWTGVVTATNSFFKIGNRTLESMQTQYEGIDDTCFGNCVTQTWTKTIEEADTLVTLGNRSATYSGTGDELVLNVSDNWPAGRGIRVIDAYGAGLHYDGRVVSIISTGGSGIIQVSPEPTSAFTSKQIRYRTLARKVFPGSKDSVTISADGLSFLSTEPWRYTVGQTIKLTQSDAEKSAKLNFGSAGIYKVASISSNIVTMDRPCEWVRTNGVPYATLAGAVGVPLPLVDVSFRFPLVRDTTTMAVTLVEGGTETWPEATTTSSIVPRKDGARGSASVYNTALGVQERGTVGVDIGVVDAGVFIAIGDSITVTSDVIVDDLDVSFATDPDFTGQVDFAVGSNMQRRKIGCRFIQDRFGSNVSGLPV